MKKHILYFFIAGFLSLFLFTESNAQVNTEPDGLGVTEEPIFTVVETMPEFPGGETALYDFIAKNVEYPALARDMGIQGKVWMGFIVRKDGSVTDVEVLRGIGGGCDEEATRVLKMMPKWTPGKQSGKPVDVKFRLPISFVLK